MQGWLQKAPTAVVVAVVVVCGVLMLGVLVAYTVMTINGYDTAEFRQWIVTVGQMLVYPMLGVTTVASLAAAKSSAAAEEQTNGHLTDRDATIRSQDSTIRVLQSLLAKSRANDPTFPPDAD